jgi:anthranilate/para-aminobenzoate synthase component I
MTYTRDQIYGILSQKDIVFSQEIVSSETDDEFMNKVQQIQQVEIQGGNICQMILSQIFE